MRIVVVLAVFLQLAAYAQAQVLCVSDCSGRKYGDYQSCLGCNVYVTCFNGIMVDNRPCPSSLVWDDNKKRCELESATCWPSTKAPPTKPSLGVSTGTGLGSSTPAPTCGKDMKPAELAILLDSTHSIKRENWPVMRQFVKDVADRVNYGPNGTRIAAIRWSRLSTEVMPLNQFPDKQSFFDALDLIPFKGGGGQVHKALNLIVESALGQSVSRGVGRIGVLIIDEKSHNTPAALAAAQRVREDGINMIVVGVERRRFDYKELVGIAGNASRVLTVDSIFELDTPEFIDELMELICADANKNGQQQSLAQGPPPPPVTPGPASLREGCDECTSGECKEWLDIMNRYRSSADPPAINMSTLCWSNKLAQVADTFTRECRFIYNRDRKSMFLHLNGTLDSQYISVGENHAVSTSPNMTIGAIVGGWYSEHADYDFATNGCSNTCQSYTQLMWAESYAVGCAKIFCPSIDRFQENPGTLAVCNFGPSGNLLGQTIYQARP